MIGVGRVFEAFHTGQLEDDDEVAVVHRGAEEGFAPLSEALVNIRATLERATEEATIGRDTGVALVAIGKRLHYPERDYRRILARAAELGLPAAELDALARWLPDNAVNRKRLDAIQMLTAMNHLVRSPEWAFRVDYIFEHTDAWESVQLAQEEEPAAAALSRDRPIVEEARLAGEGAAVTTGALAWALAARLSNDLGEPDAAAIQQAREEFRRGHDLTEAAAFDRWLDEQELRTDEDIAAFFARVADVRRLLALLRPEIAASAADFLRATGRYGHHRRRAREKTARLAGLDAHPLGLSDSELWSRYFTHVLGREAPRDLASYAAREGFESVEALRDAVVRELHYRRLIDPR
jgi:hypothetical protein